MVAVRAETCGATGAVTVMKSRERKPVTVQLQVPAKVHALAPPSSDPADRKEAREILNQATFHLNNNNLEEALAAYNSALKFGLYGEQIYFGIADTSEALGLLDDAIRAYDDQIKVLLDLEIELENTDNDYIKHNPQKIANARFRQVGMFAALGRLDEIRTALTDVITFNHQLGIRAFLHVGVIFAAHGQHENALQSISAGLRYAETETNHELFKEIAHAFEKISRYGTNISKNYYSTYVGDATSALKAAADLLATVYPADNVRKALEDLAANTARETTARAEAKPRILEPAAEETTTRKRGPRVKPNPALPVTAPEIYRNRKPLEELAGHKEDVVQFVERAYAPWREILTRADLRRLDESADAAVERWINKGKQLPKGLLLTEYELNIDKRLLEGKRRPKRRFARTLRGGDPPGPR
jgi:tetratricopeptide (TPR) repeat protein